MTAVGKKRTKMKTVIDLPPVSQYACAQCITYKRILRAQDLEIGGHLCFKTEENFIHAILTNIIKTKTVIQICVVCLCRDIPKIFKICRQRTGPKNQGGNTDMAEELLTLGDVANIGIYVMQYGRKIYNGEKISKRALTLVKVPRRRYASYGSLSSQRIRPEADFNSDIPDMTSAHVATWCSTGESFSFDTSDIKKKFKYKEKGHVISMILTLWEEDGYIKQWTKFYRKHLLCDSCYLSELVTLINRNENPTKHYSLLSQNNITMSYEQKLPGGLYNMKYVVEYNHVIIIIKRYNSKYKIFASIVQTEIFNLTLDKRDRCFMEKEVSYKFPYPCWRTPESNPEKF